jgi:hypothetical protein
LGKEFFTSTFYYLLSFRIPSDGSVKNLKSGFVLFWMDGDFSSILSGLAQNHVEKAFFTSNIFMLLERENELALNLSFP